MSSPSPVQSHRITTTGLPFTRPTSKASVAVKVWSPAPLASLLAKGASLGLEFRLGDRGVDHVVGIGMVVVNQVVGVHAHRRGGVGGINAVTQAWA